MFTKYFSRSRRTARRPQQQRRMFFEPLEDRRLLACVFDEWPDTNLDRFVSPIDALLVINYMQEQGGAVVGGDYTQAQTPGMALDVDGDKNVTPYDVDIVVRDIDTNGSHPLVLECPKEAGTMTVVQKVLGSMDIVVENQKDVVLLRFEAHADDVEDLFISGARFNTSVGTSVDISEFALWVDTDGNNLVDTILDEGDADLTDIVGGGYVIPANGTVAFEVHGDVSSSITGSQFQLAFAEDHPITAEALDDGSSLEGITVVPVDSTLFTLQESGTLSVVKDSTPIRSHQLLGGTLGEISLRLEFRAEAEPVEVTYIGVDVEGESRSIDRLEAFLPGATAPFAVATKAGAKPGDTFGFNTNSAQLVVDKLSSEDALIRPRMKSDADGGVSGDQFALAVDQVFARGWTSSNEIDPDVAPDIESPSHTVVMTKVDRLRNANPDADRSAIQVGAGPSGQIQIGGLPNANVQSGPNKMVTDHLVLTMNSVNVAFDATAFRLYNKADSTVKEDTYHLERLDGTSISVTGIVSGSFNIIFDDLEASPVNTVIDSGQSATFVLETNVTNPSVSSTQASSLQVSLQLDDPDFIRWFDRDFGGSTQFSWIEYPDTIVRSTLYQS